MIQMSVFFVVCSPRQWELQALVFLLALLGDLLRCPTFRLYSSSFFPETASIIILTLESLMLTSISAYFSTKTHLLHSCDEVGLFDG